ncbi:MAG: response regulator [Acholeplasmataceae bacterium]|nr:response regulator [Acholeplasmataceae bacterium]
MKKQLLDHLKNYIKTSNGNLDTLSNLLVALQNDMQLSYLGISFFGDSQQPNYSNIALDFQGKIANYLMSDQYSDLLNIISLDDHIILIRNSNHYLLMNEEEYEQMDHDIAEFIIYELSNLVDVIILKQKLDKQIQETNLRQRILDQMPEMIAIKDVNNKFIFVNKAADNAFRYEFDTVAGKYVDEIYPQSEVEKIYALDQKVYDAQHPIKTDIEMLISLGFIHAETDRRVFKDENQNTIGILTVNRDITQRKIMEDELKNSLQFQNELLAIAQQFINVDEDKVEEAIENALGKSGSFIFADRAYVFDYNLDKQIMINTHEWCSEGTEPSIHLLQDVPIADFMEDWYKPHLEGKEIYVPFVDELDHDSNLYAILNMQEIKSLLTIPLFYNKTLFGFIGFDATKKNREWSIHERRLLNILAELIVNLKRNQLKNIELQNAKMVAEQANKSKAIFLANMSHELRTPISGIYSSISLLQETKIDSEQLEYIEIAKISIESLAVIINDILDLTKIEHGNFALEYSYFNLENEIYQIYKMQESAIIQKELIFDFDFDYKINHMVFFDRLRLRQIILNLISNALKFTEKGMIQLSVKIIDETDNSFLLEFSVLDTGIGIQKDIIDHITDQFVQGDLATTKNYSGTGLGLAIVNGILDHYGSQIEIESELGFGSKFKFVLNMQKGVLLKHKLITMKGKKVLCLANPDSFLIKKQSFFDEFGIKLYFNYLDDALFSGNIHYDYILIHVSNKKIDKSMIRDIANKYVTKDTEMILVNTSGDMFHNNELLEMKIDYLFTFPTTREKFIQVISSKKTIQYNREFCQIDSKTKNYCLKDLNLLVVDENKINSQAIEAILNKREIRVVLASSGYEAIEAIKNQHFDIVLMDIQMPGMDGYTATKKIRDLGYTMDDLVIISMSATNLSLTHEEILRIGINDSVPKPFKVDQLLDKIRKYAKKDTKNNLTILSVPEKLKPFNEVLFMTVFDKKPDLGFKIMQGFKEDYSSDITKIEISFNQNNVEKLISDAHYFKGSASYVGAERVAWICEKIIEHCKKNKMSELRQLVYSITDEIELWKTDANIWISREENV